MKLFKIEFTTYNIIASLIVVGLLWLGFVSGLFLWFHFLGARQGADILAAILIVKIIKEICDLSIKIFKA